MLNICIKVQRSPNWKGSWVFDLVVQHLIVYYITEHACTSVSVLQRGKVYLTQTLIYDLVCVSADKVQVL